MAIEKVVASLYNDGSGYIVQTLLGDFFIVALVGIVSNFLVAPAYRHYQRYQTTVKNVPSPKPHWLLGDLKTYAFTPSGLKQMVERCKDFPAMAMFRIGWVTWQVQVYHPDVVKEIINKPYPKGGLYKRVVCPLLHNGLLVSSGEYWKRNRRMLNPIFNFEILKSHVLVFNKNCNDFLKRLEAPANTSTKFNVTIPIAEAGFADLMECVMSRKVEKEGDAKEFVKITNEVSTLMMLRLSKVVYIIDAIWYKLALGKRFTQCVDSIWKLAHRFIREREEQLNLLTSTDDQTSIKDDVTGEQITIKRRKGKLVDFLDILIQTKDQQGIGLTNHEMVQEVVTFIGAGQETTAAAIGWILYTLSNQPIEQEKCRNEIMEIMGNENEVTWSHIGKLNYVTMCIKEVLRLYPVAHIIGRELPEDFTFKDPLDASKNVTLPKGTTVSINIHVLHRNVHIWEDPNEFIPERFLPENTAKRSPYAFIPFSAGHRNCIGQNFAMSKMKVFLCKLLKNYEIYRDDSTVEPVLFPGAALLAEDGIELKFRKI